MSSPLQQLVGRAPVQTVRSGLMIGGCTKPPRPGAHRAIPNDEYQKWDAASSSRLGVLVDESPMHLRYKIEHGDAETDAKTRGTLMHAAMLEPERFGKEYAIGPDVNLSTKIGKAEWDAFIKDHPGKYHIRGKDGGKILGMRASLWKHSLASSLLRACGESELSLTWVDKSTGVICKARIDRLCLAKSGRRIVDLKKTTNSKPEIFTNRVYEYGYYIQGHLYLSGVAAVMEPVEFYDILSVEETPPYAVCVHQLTDDQLDMGRAACSLALELYKRCCGSREWPGYGYNWSSHRYELVKIGDPPAWMRSRLGGYSG